LSKARRKFGDEVTVLSQTTYLVSVSKNINSRALPVVSRTILRTLLARTLPQVTTGNEASCPGQQHDFNAKTW